jgi:nucleoside phosphorylase
MLPGVQPGRVSTGRVAILTILEEEFEAVERQIGPIREIEDAYYKPEGDGHDVVLMRAADRGNVPAEQAVKELVEAFRPEVLIVCGIGGGVEGKDDIATGDVVVADYLHYGEFRKLSEHGDHDRYLAYDQPSAMLRSKQALPVVRIGDWTSRIDVARPDGVGQPKVVIGPVLAGEKVMGDPDHLEQQRALSRYTDAIAVDMESYGAARALHCARTDVDYDPLLMVIRGISDIVENPRRDVGETVDTTAVAANNAQRALWKPYACATAAAFASAMVDRLVSRPDLRQALRT